MRRSSVGCSGAARNIQRVYRGYRGRQRASTHKQHKKDAEAKAYYDAMATVIQRVWRGVVSRGTKQNFFARKAYIQTVTATGLDLSAQIERDAEKRRVELAELTLSENAREFERVTSGLHHMLSTAAQPGFFRSPFGDSYHPTAFGVPIETHLKAAFNARYPTVKRQQKEKRKQLLAATGASGVGGTMAIAHTLAGSTFTKAASGSRGSSRAGLITTPQPKPYQRLNNSQAAAAAVAAVGVAVAATESAFEQKAGGGGGGGGEEAVSGGAAAGKSSTAPPATGTSTAPATTAAVSAAVKSPLTTSLARPLTLSERLALYPRPGAAAGIDFCADRTKYKPIRPVDPINEIRESEGGVASDSTDPRATQMALESVFGTDSLLSTQTLRREEAKSYAAAQHSATGGGGGMSGGGGGGGGVSGASFYDMAAPPIVHRKTMPHTAAARQHILASANGTYIPAIGSAAAALKAAQLLLRPNLDSTRQREEEWKNASASNQALASRPPFAVNPKSKPAPSKISVVTNDTTSTHHHPSPPQQNHRTRKAVSGTGGGGGAVRTSSKSSLLPAVASAVRGGTGTAS